MDWIPSIQEGELAFYSYAVSLDKAQRYFIQLWLDSIYVKLK